MKVAKFIRSCAHPQSVNQCSHEANHTLHTIDSDTSFDVGIYRLLETMGHNRFGWISQDSNMPGLYDNIWYRSSQCIEVNYIIPG